MQASVATPGASRRIRLLLLVALAFVAGLLLQDALSERLAEIVARAEHDRLAARAELATWLRGVIGTACGLTAAFGLAIAVACRAPGRAERFPPPGFLSVARPVTGLRARTMTRAGLVLGLALLAASLAAIAFAWHAAAVLSACRA